MNAREKILLVALVGILGLGIGGYAAKVWWLDPFKEYGAAIERLEDENQAIDTQLAVFYKDQKKLKLARLKSLPAVREQAEAEYMAYLNPLLARSGLNIEELRPGATQKLKPGTGTPSVKDVGLQIMSFTVRANGQLNQLVKALEQLNKSPYEQRIRSLTVDRAETSPTKKDPNPKLNVLMTIETLLVAKTENKPGLPPGVNPYYLQVDHMVSFEPGFAPINFGLIAASLQQRQTVPTPLERDYADIARKNIFVGALPPEPTPPKKKPPEKKIEIVVEPPDPGPQPPEEYVPAFVRLVHTDPGQQTAYLRNIRFRVPEMKLVAKAQSGYDTFRITDEIGDYVYFRAKVLKIEQRQIFFQIKDQVYSVQTGQYLSDMKEMSFSLTRIELEDLGLYDREFAKSELEKDKKNKKDNKGRPTSKTPVKGK